MMQICGKGYSFHFNSLTSLGVVITWGCVRQVPCLRPGLYVNKCMKKQKSDGVGENFHVWYKWFLRFCLTSYCNLSVLLLSILSSSEGTYCGVKMCGQAAT